MRLLLCSDIHCDEAKARHLVRQSKAADVLVCAGDLAVMRRGLDDTVSILSGSDCPAVLVPGNGESDQELVEACRGWDGAHVLHGSGCTIDGVSFWGLGGGVPVTPFGAWSFDLTEDAARALLESCPDEAILVTHSPPYGHVDADSGGTHLGSHAVLEAVEHRAPALVVCGHIHAGWTQVSRLGRTPIINAGPDGVWFEL